ncbi:MAG: electron transport complex subunit RsxE [Brevinema sp.]
MAEFVSQSSWSEFEKGILKQNPIYVLAIGLCSSLAVSANVSTALAMGVGVIFVLTCSNVIISLLRKLIPSSVRVPAYIVVIAGFTTIVEILMGRYTESLYKLLGVYLPLIVVNCIILGRAEAFASKNNPFRSLLDGLGMGIGYTLALVSIAILRELLGSGTLSFQISETVGVVLNFTHPVLQDPNNPFVHVVNLFGQTLPPVDPTEQYLTVVNVLHIVPDPLFLLKMPPGGFLVMGLYLAILQQISIVKAKRLAMAKVAAAKASAEKGE